MANTRFFELYNSIGYNDIKRFDELINSPFFNKSARLILLWKFLRPRIETESSVTSKEICEAIFINEKYTDSNFRMVLSSFVELAEEYLLQKEYLENEMERDIRLLEIFANRGMRKSFVMYLNIIEKELDKVQNRNSVYYYRKYFIECLKGKNSGGDIKAAREFAKKAYTSL